MKKCDSESSTFELKEIVTIADIHNANHQVTEIARCLNTVYASSNDDESDLSSNILDVRQNNIDGDIFGQIPQNIQLKECKNVTNGHQINIHNVEKLILDDKANSKKTIIGEEKIDIEEIINTSNKQFYVKNVILIISVLIFYGIVAYLVCVTILNNLTLHDKHKLFSTIQTEVIKTASESAVKTTVSRTTRRTTITTTPQPTTRKWVGSYPKVKFGPLVLENVANVLDVKNDELEKVNTNTEFQNILWGFLVKTVGPINDYICKNIICFYG